MAHHVPSLTAGELPGPSAAAPSRALQSRWFPPLAIFLTGFLWSFGGVLSKSLPWSPYSIVGVRALVATLILGKARGSFRLKLSPGVWMGGLGVICTGLLFMIANKLTTAANAIVLQYAMPLFVVLASLLLLRQRPTRLEVAAAVVVAAGVAMCFAEGLGGGTPQALLGDCLALLSAATYACVFFASRLTGCDPMDFAFFGNMLGCGFLVTVPFDPNFTVTPATLATGLAMGVILGLGYLFFSLGMRTGLSPIAAAIIANVEPVLNPTWVFLLMGEYPGDWALAGAITVLLAVTVYSILGGRRPRDQ